MKLFDQLEYLRYDLIKDKNINWDVYYNLNLNDHGELMKSIDKFLLSLKHNHELSGKDYQTLQGIAQWIKKNNYATDKQKIFVIFTMACYWDQLDYFKMT